ncbi:Unannotated [Lentimonas sp. CC19]|nr:Unannotated [Lentimonas sp. CC10]CAA6693057.1 Unannotated [Lentimonas sp. CC19]CAA7069036.1 Unannotated [Lentimonas sp. CC11]
MVLRDFNKMYLARKYNRNSGFSLIEVMIGVAVFSIVLLAIPAALVANRKLNFRTDSQTRASMLVLAELEGLRTIEFSDVKDFVANPRPNVSDEHLGIQYLTVLEVAEGEDELEGMLDAKVMVTWTQDGRLQEVVGRAFFTENGLSDKSHSDAN